MNLRVLCIPHDTKPNAPDGGESSVKLHYGQWVRPVHEAGLW